MDNGINLTDLPISLEGISKRYKEKGELALKKIDLTVREGEFLCLVGPSGCGKSTLIKIIAGIEKQTEGTILRNGDVSMVFQSGALLPWLNVFENAAFGLKMQGVGEAQAKEKVLPFLEMMGLLGFLQKYPRELSGGQKQRVGIARALTLEAPILLLDEPFSALDLITTRELHGDLLKIWQQTKKTIVMISHSLEEAVFLADKIAVMEKGEIKKILPIELKRPRDDRSDEFLSIVKKLSNEFQSSITG